MSIQTEKEFIDLMTDQVRQAEDITENIKSLKDEAKEAGFDGALLLTVAKAIVKSKQSELQEKSQGIVDLIGKL